MTGVQRIHLVTLLAAIGIVSVFVSSGCRTPGPAPTEAETYRAPRTPDGHPDLQGVWQAVNTAVWNIQDHPPELGIPAGQGVVDGNEIPYKPEALERRDENRKNRLTADPEAKCWMVGVPRITYMPYPFEIVQTAKQITMLYEYVHTVRNLYLDSVHPEGRGRRDRVVHGRLTGAVGGRDAGGGRHAFQPGDLVRPFR